MVVFVPRVVVYFIHQSKGRHTFWMKNVFSFEAPLTALSHISFALCLELG